jgi:hypothetical protein
MPVGDTLEFTLSMGCFFFGWDGVQDNHNHHSLRPGNPVAALRAALCLVSICK